MLGHKKNTVPKASHSDKLGIYIHIPFCRSKCDYCDFYSLAGREEQMDRYQKALLAHIRGEPSIFHIMASLAKD